MNQNPSVRKLVRCGVVAAIYVVLCMALQPLSYGAVQVRVAEALCLLPVFGAEYIAGVVLGCFLAKRGRENCFEMDLNLLDEKFMKQN